MGFFLAVLALLHAAIQNSGDKNCLLAHDRCFFIAKCSNYEYNGSQNGYHIRFDKDTGEYQIIQKSGTYLYVLRPDDFIEACKNNNGVANVCRRKSFFVQNLPIIALKKLNEVPETTEEIRVDFMRLSNETVTATDVEDYFHPELECAALELARGIEEFDWRCFGSQKIVLFLALDDSKISKRFSRLDFSHVDPTTHGQRVLYAVGNLPRYSDFCDENDQKKSELVQKLKIYNVIDENQSSFCRSRENIRIERCSESVCTNDYGYSRPYVIGFDLKETNQESLDCVSAKIPKEDLRFLQKTYKYDEPTLKLMRFDNILMIQIIIATLLVAIAIALLIVNIMGCYRRRSGTRMADSNREENFYMAPSGKQNDSVTQSRTNQNRNQAIKLRHNQRKSGDVKEEEGNAYQERKSVDFNAPKPSRVSKVVGNSSPGDPAILNGNIQNAAESPYDEYVYSK